MKVINSKKFFDIYHESIDYHDSINNWNRMRETEDIIPHLCGIDLTGADLKGIDFYGAELSGACLRYADLRGADLRYANLRGADLTDADLRDTHLCHADLRGTRIEGACLIGAYVHGTIGSPGAIYHDTPPEEEVIYTTSSCKRPTFVWDVTPDEDNK
jgi:hypothetical protein